MQKFEEVYAALNPQQRQAVDTVYGPVLVIAGPGTGKTQLLSARVARILQTTDASPQNILCLTFTENGAVNMRERLTRFIGQAAYDVQIGTYHSFGSTVISQFPEYFTELRLERPVDELGKRQILADIIETVDYRSPIKQVRHHIGDLVATISEVKRGLFSPSDLRTIAKENLAVITATQPVIAETLAPYAARMPSKLAVAEPLFHRIYDVLATTAAGLPEKQRTVSHAELAAEELNAALETAQDMQKTTPLTKWKNKWLVKNNDNQFVLAGALESARVKALADVLEQYQTQLAEKGLYDFDDMILQAIDVLAHNNDLRYTLQEQFQFILLDEFQDTNAAQLRLVQLLTDNPVHEGRPNVLAVGDDDQAIYAFQGAQYSNMLDFFKLYRDVQVISLEDNYRSRGEILHTATNIAGQIEARLHSHFDGISKQLIARNTRLPAVMLERRAYQSAVAERAAIAEHIATLINEGVQPSEIAVLAPKHKYLEPLVPYLRAKEIAVSYEKREDILQSLVVRQLLTMSRLILALQDNQPTTANSLWPQILSYDFWDFSVSDIWRMSWQASDNHTPWVQLLLNSPQFHYAALLFLTLAGKAETEPLETMLDALIGTTEVQTHDRKLPSVRSPLREYYLNKQGDSVLYETANQLTVLRSKLRAYQAAEHRVLTLRDLITFVNLYESAEQPMLNTSPYNQAEQAVQLMTVFKAKGLEFDHVFLISCQDDVWGSRAGGASNKLTLPANLIHIRHAGVTDDERLRLLFVALTRARFGLHLTSHAQSYTGKPTEAIKYFDETVDDGKAIANILPVKHAVVAFDDQAAPELEALTVNWQQRHSTHDTPLRELLLRRLQTYQLSPTHLTQFLNLKHGGPENFLLHTLLRFPTAPTVDTAFGNVIHRTLEWLQNDLNRFGTRPTAPAANEYAAKIIAQEPFTDVQKSLLTERARSTLAAYLSAPNVHFQPGNIPEKSFRQEGVFVGKAHLGGKIDLLEIDTAARAITVVDYKTGRVATDPLKMRRYTIQLYCYKILIEGSHTYKGYRVDTGRLVFVEPDDHGVIQQKELNFTPHETARIRELLTAMWHRIVSLDFPDVSTYTDSLTDMKRFEEDLIKTAVTP